LRFYAPAAKLPAVIQEQAGEKLRVLNQLKQLAVKNVQNKNGDGNFPPPFALKDFYFNPTR
jgi:hypothetical protein